MVLLQNYIICCLSFISFHFTHRCSSCSWFKLKQIQSGILPSVLVLHLIIRFAIKLIELQRIKQIFDVMIFCFVCVGEVNQWIKLISWWFQFPFPSKRISNGESIGILMVIMMMIWLWWWFDVWIIWAIDIRNLSEFLQRFFGSIDLPSNPWLFHAFICVLKDNQTAKVTLNNVQTSPSL